MFVLCNLCACKNLEMLKLLLAKGVLSHFEKILGKTEIFKINIIIIEAL